MVDMEVLAYEHALAEQMKELVRQFNELSVGAANAGLLVEVRERIGSARPAGAPRIVSVELTISKQL